MNFPNPNKKNQKKIAAVGKADEGIKELEFQSNVQEPAESENDLDIMLDIKRRRRMPRSQRRIEY